MAVSNIYGQKTKYRITLELDVQDDFNPRQIDWRKVLQIEEDLAYFFTIHLHNNYSILMIIYLIQH